MTKRIRGKNHLCPKCFLKTGGALFLSWKDVMEELGDPHPDQPYHLAERARVAYQMAEKGIPYKEVHL
jgi:hypothetical protein